jgi:hypothetical protein
MCVAVISRIRPAVIGASKSSVSCLDMRYAEFVDPNRIRRTYTSRHTPDPDCVPFGLVVFQYELEVACPEAS